MSISSLPNHLRAHRKRSGLSQDEIAFLLGSKNGARVCRHEQFRQNPNLKTMLAYEILFRTPARELFPGAREEAERALFMQVSVLANKLAKEGKDRLAAHKLQFLNAVLDAQAATRWKFLRL